MCASIGYLTQQRISMQWLRNLTHEVGKLWHARMQDEPMVLPIGRRKGRAFDSQVVQLLKHQRR